MKLYYICPLLTFFFFLSPVLIAQERNAELGGEGYREHQYPGLSEAASKIFFSDSWITFSGYLEVNQIIPSFGQVDKSSGELELYYSDLYRFSPFVGVRLSKKVMLTMEYQFEYLRDADRESELHTNPELYIDVLGSPHFNFRAGVYPLNIGYINNNEEPILFYSVNRPDVERLIIPTGWNEFGLGLYGVFKEDFQYFLTLGNGIIGKEFRSPTWIRGGRDVHFNFNRISINPQLNYTGFKNLTLSLSGYYSDTGRGESIALDGSEKEVIAPVVIGSGYFRWDYKALRLIGVGIVGNLSSTEDLYVLSGQKGETMQPQVLGENVFGYYAEAGFDLFYYLLKNKSKRTGYNEKHGRIFRREQAQLPIFARFERMDTHETITQSLQGIPTSINDLSILTFGLNYEPNEKVSIKLDYQFKWNDALPTDKRTEVMEVGFGISF